MKRQQSTRAWFKQPPEPQVYGKGTGKSKSKVAEISESDSSEQVEEAWTPNTSCAAIKFVSSEHDWMRLWIFLQEDSKKTSTRGELGKATRGVATPCVDSCELLLGVQPFADRSFSDLCSCYFFVS